MSTSTSSLLALLRGTSVLRWRAVHPMTLFNASLRMQVRSGRQQSVSAVWCAGLPSSRERRASYARAQISALRSPGTFRSRQRHAGKIS